MAETVLDKFVTHLLFRADMRALDRMERRINKIRGNLNDFSRRVGAIGLASATAAAGTLTAFARYETGFAEMAAKTGKSMADLEAEYGAAVKAISKLTTVSMADVQDGFQKGISAGVEGEALIRMVTQAAKSQAAGIGNLAATLSSATTAYEVLGIDGAKAMDIITRAAQVGEGETEDYGRSLKGLVGFAKTLGFDFVELSGGMAAVAKTAATVKEGETQFRSFLKSIASPSAQAEKQLAALNAGFTFADLRETIRTKGLVAGFSMLQQFIADLKAQGTEVAPIIAKMFPDIEAQQFLNTVNASALADSAQAVRDHNGAIEDAFQDGNRTVERVFKRTMRGAEVLVVGIGKELVPAFQSLNDVVASTLEWFDSLGGGSKKLAGQALAIGSALLAVAAGAKALAFVLGGLGLLRIFGMIAGGIALFFSPIGAAIAAVVAAVVAAGYYIWKNWDKVVAFFERAKGRLGEVWDEVTAFFKDSAARIVEKVGNAKGRLGEAWDDVVAFFEDGAARVGEMIDEIGMAFGRIKGFWDKALTVFKDGVAKLKGFVGEIIDEMAKIGKGWWDKGVDLGDTIVEKLTPGGSLLPVAPQAGAAGPASVEVNIGDVTIQAQGANADELYRDAGRALQREVARGYEQFASPF